MIAASDERCERGGRPTTRRLMDRPRGCVDGNALLSPRSRHARPHDNSTRQHSSTHRVGALMSHHPSGSCKDTHSTLGLSRQFHGFPLDVQNVQIFQAIFHKALHVLSSTSHAVLFKISRQSLTILLCPPLGLTPRAPSVEFFYKFSRQCITMPAPIFQILPSRPSRCSCAQYLD